VPRLRTQPSLSQAALTSVRHPVRVSEVSLRRRSLLMPALAAAVSVAAGIAIANAGAAATAVKASLPSHALRSKLHFLVYLPADYATSLRRRYPVVYFLHGLPAGPQAYLQLGWVEQALEESGRRAILVLPQATRRVNGDPEYHDWGAGENWETALAKELPAWVDAHFRTIATRGGRAIVGVSAGGYGAAIIGLHHLSEYAVIESWSGYFRPTDPTGAKTLDVGSDVANAHATVQSLVPSLAHQFRRYPTFFAFYVGAADPTFVPDNTTLDRALTGAGVSHLFRTYPGGHSTSVWAAHAAAWLTMALDHLRPPGTA
jgi:putative tributyrin esterase